eukprot:6722772-Prymnesium_polylepis.1
MPLCGRSPDCPRQRVLALLAARAAVASAGLELRSSAHTCSPARLPVRPSVPLHGLEPPPALETAEPT